MRSELLQNAFQNGLGDRGSIASIFYPAKKYGIYCIYIQNPSTCAAVGGIQEWSVYWVVWFRKFKKGCKATLQNLGIDPWPAHNGTHPGFLLLPSGIVSLNFRDSNSSSSVSSVSPFP